LSGGSAIKVSPIISVFREEKINNQSIVFNRPRPLSVEVPFKAFAGEIEKKDFEEL